MMDFAFSNNANRRTLWSLISSMIAESTTLKVMSELFPCVCEENSTVFGIISLIRTIFAIIKGNNV